jgi:hypothetical protein
MSVVNRRIGNKFARLLMGLIWIVTVMNTLAGPATAAATFGRRSDSGCDYSARLVGDKIPTAVSSLRKIYDSTGSYNAMVAIFHPMDTRSLLDIWTAVVDRYMAMGEDFWLDRLMDDLGLSPDMVSTVAGGAGLPPLEVARIRFMAICANCSWDWFLAIVDSALASPDPFSITQLQSPPSDESLSSKTVFGGEGASDICCFFANAQFLLRNLTEYCPEYWRLCADTVEEEEEEISEIEILNGEVVGT